MSREEGGKVDQNMDRAGHDRGRDVRDVRLCGDGGKKWICYQVSVGISKLMFVWKPRRDLESDVS